MFVIRERFYAHPVYCSMMHGAYNVKYIYHRSGEFVGVKALDVFMCHTSYLFFELLHFIFALWLLRESVVGI
jgi:hypothetical protein